MSKLVFGIGINDACTQSLPVRMPGNVCDSPYYRVWKSVLRRCKRMGVSKVDIDLIHFSKFVRWAHTNDYNADEHSIALTNNTLTRVGLSHLVIIPSTHRTILRIPDGKRELPPWVNRATGVRSKRYFYTAAVEGKPNRVHYPTCTRAEAQQGGMLNRAKNLRLLAKECTGDTTAKLNAVAAGYEELAKLGKVVNRRVIEAVINQEIVALTEGK